MPQFNLKKTGQIQSVGYEKADAVGAWARVFPTDRIGAEALAG